MKILHVCWGTGTNNGAANIARLIMGEQRAAGGDPLLVSRPTWAQLRAADQVWCHCGWYWILWLLAAYKRFCRPSASPSRVDAHDPAPTPSACAYLHWVPEGCYDPVRLRYHGWKKALVGPIERWALRQADVLDATCAAEADWIRAYLGDLPAGSAEGPEIAVNDIKRFFKLTAAFPSPSVAARSPRLNVLYLGRPHPLKGVTYLELAVRAVNDFARTSLTMCPADGVIALRQARAAKGEELERLWDWCDVLCLPTLSDNFGLVVAEALERGKRVLTTDGAPAWEPEKKSSVDGEEWRARLFYLKGYREGDDARRVKLLTDALAHLAR